jgi:predicted nucleotidyltransferase component of viral defense system
MWLPETEKVLNVLSLEEDVKDYVFIGGSALSYYLNHRLSEDIDLATPDEFLKMDKHIDKMMEGLFKKGFNIEEGIESSAVSASKRDFYVNNVKVTFFASGDDFLKTEKKRLTGNLYIANLDTLIGMKTAVIHHRIAIRDYYDLYVITKEFGLEKALREAGILYNKKVGNKEFFKFDETNFLKFAVDLNGIDREKLEPELNPKYDITKSEIQQFFEEQIKEYISQTMQKIRENTPKEDAFTKDLNNRLNKGKGWNG